MPQAPLWRPVGRNAYGETVEESNGGLRRVATVEGWREETQVPGWRVCRAQTQLDVRQAMASLSDPWVSEAFGHNVLRAYIVWRLKSGQVFAGVPDGWGTEQDAGWVAFRKGVERARGDRVTRAWLRHRPQAPDVPLWDKVLTSPGGSSPRALQWGLAHRIEHSAKQLPYAVFCEFGLVEPGDAATARLRTERRQAWAQQLGEPWMPAAQTGLPPLPVAKRSAFGAKGHDAAWSSLQVPVVWLTPASVAKVPAATWAAWWPVLAAQESGWVVVCSAAKALVGPLAGMLRAKGRVLSRWRLPDATEVWTWQANPPTFDQAMTWAQWACPQENIDGDQREVLEDDRVRYRALSQVSPAEGCAGRRLEASMHAALRDWSWKHHAQGLDGWVAEGAGIALDKLPEALSAEQVDAVGLARTALEAGAGFLLADETGFGKGRIIAAMALTGLAQGRAVVVLTENPDLFSDMYRDFLAVSGAHPPLPIMLHQDATLRDLRGKIVSKSVRGQAFKALLKQKAWPEDFKGPRLIFTTYAQLARAHDEPKLSWLKTRLGHNGWLLMDEAHNAAGDSAVGARVERLVDAAFGTVFASATFAKHEANLGLYKPALNLPKTAHRLLKQAMAGDDGRLREALTQALGRAGRLVRREHPPTPPPEPRWVAMTPERNVALEAFEDAWQGIFEAVDAYDREAGQQGQVWLKLGAALSRSSREFGVLMKADALIETIDEALAANEKPVIVVESTFEAALHDALTPDADLADDEVEEANPVMATLVREGKGAPPLWRDRLRAILEAAAPLEEGRLEDIALVSARAAAETAIARLPDWDLAPLDRLHDAMTQRGIRSGELSGRQTSLQRSAEGWALVPRAGADRQAVRRAFNEGDLDVVFVTRAGCTGISLHAGKTFTDQRRRCLIEWDIALNPVSRVQFWGRVRRKDQVCEPRFLGLVLDTAADRRMIEREDNKRRKMAAHMGARPQADVGLLTEVGEQVVREWAHERAVPARRLGVSREILDNPIGRVDRVLVRSLVLPSLERTALLERLTRGVHLGSQVWHRERQDWVTRSSRSLRRAWWWGDPGSARQDPAEALASLRLDAVERVWRPETGGTVTDIAQAIHAARANSPTGAQVLEAWREAWTQETRNGALATPYRKQIWGWASKYLPTLSPGVGIVLTDPGRNRSMRAVVLDWDLPETFGDGLQGASPWALSQVGLRVWIVGDRAPLQIPLSRLATDVAFKSSGKPAASAWFDLPALPFVGVTVEGHPVQAAAWGRAWGVGRSILVRDEDEGESVVWLLPSTWSWEKVLSLPRDLVDVDHAIEFFHAHSSESLQASLPLGQVLLAQPIQGGLRIAFNPAAHAAATKTWLGFALGRRLGRLIESRTDIGWMETNGPIAWKNVPVVLHAFASAGIGWRCDAKHAAWLAKTSAVRCSSQR